MGSAQFTLERRVKPGRLGEIVFCAHGIPQREPGSSTIAVGWGVLWVEFNSVIRQSRKGTGFDYWIGEASTEGFLDKAGLEISGIRRGNDRVVKARVKEKLQQAKQSGAWPT